MNVVGIPAEYNPLHKGHIYHMKEAVARSKADYLVVAMSGNFTQRGEMAVADKWMRSTWAVDSGADLVLEIPLIFACNVAEQFARGAIDTLVKAGVTHVAFGCEADDPNKLSFLAKNLIDSEEHLKTLRRDKMSSGASYAKANEYAVCQVLGSEAANLISSPNNILAIEYLKRLSYWKCCGKNVEAVPIKRLHSGYYGINREAKISGASEIRNLISVGNQVEAAEYLDGIVSDWSRSAEINGPEENYFKMLKFEIMRSSAEELSMYMGVGEGLENKLKKEILLATSYSDLLSRLTSRRYTASAMRRMLAYIALGIKKSNMESFEIDQLRLLGASLKGRGLIKMLKEDVNIITNVNKSGEISELINIDIRSQDIFNLVQDRNIYKYSDRVMTPYVQK